MSCQETCIQHSQQLDAPTTMAASEHSVPICTQCGAEVSPTGRFCTSCGADLAGGGQGAVCFAEVLRLAFGGEANSFWRKALRCAGITVPGLACFVVAIYKGIAGGWTAAGCAATVTASVAYMLFCVRRRICPDGSGLASRLVLVGYAGVAAAALYLPAVMIGGMLRDTGSRLVGPMLAIPLVVVAYAMVIVVATAAGAPFAAAAKPVRAAKPQALLRTWLRGWHRYCGIILFVAAYVLATVPVCILITFAPGLLRRANGLLGGCFLVPFCEIAARLADPRADSIAVDASHKAKAWLRALAMAMVVKLPEALAACWYVLMVVASELVGHAHRGDMIVFEPSATTQTTGQGEDR